jgi:hypothetical protein
MLQVAAALSQHCRNIAIIWVDIAATCHIAARLQQSLVAASSKVASSWKFLLPPFLHCRSTVAVLLQYCGNKTFSVWVILF